MPDRSPDLPPALPAGAPPPDQVHLLGELRECRMTDGSWQPVTVLAQAPDLGGGWRVQLRWFDRGTHTGWFLIRGSKERERFRGVSE